VDAWGDSALQPVVDAIRSAGLVASSIAAMISEAKIDVIKIPRLTQQLATSEGTKRVYERWSNANVSKSVINATLIDKEEELERIVLRTQGMDRVLSSYLLICAGAADIPATRMLGREPAEMNATGESDMRNYYDRLSADQKVRLTPALARLDDVLIRHRLGDRPVDLHFHWNPLWQLDDVQKADMALKKAQTFKIDNDSGLFKPDMLRTYRENQLSQDETYPGIEAAIEEHGDEPDEGDEGPLQLAQLRACGREGLAPGPVGHSRSRLL